MSETNNPPVARPPLSERMTERLDAAWREHRPIERIHFESARNEVATLEAQLAAIRERCERLERALRVADNTLTEHHAAHLHRDDCPMFEGGHTCIPCQNADVFTVIAHALRDIEPPVRMAMMSDNGRVEAEYPEHRMDCYVCGVSVATERGQVDMPQGWGFVMRSGYCLDGRPGLEAFYACPDCKEEDD